MTKQRVKTYKQIKKRRKSTVQEILSADFGTYPPNGVELAIAPKQPVHVGPFLGTQSTELNALYTNLFFDQMNRSREEKGQPTIPLTRGTRMYGSIIVTIMLNLMGLKSAIKDAGRVTPSPNQEIHFIQHNSAFYAGHQEYVLGHEAIHVMQDCHSACPLRTNEPYEIGDSFWLQSTGKSTKDHILNYVIRGHEIQAYLHTALAEGYQLWNKLPQTKEDLWAAMIAMGFYCPEKIKETLESSPTGQQALADFQPLPTRLNTNLSHIAAIGAFIGATAGLLSGPDLALTASKTIHVAKLAGYGAIGTSGLDTLSNAWLWACGVFKGSYSSRLVNIAQHRAKGEQYKEAFWNELIPALYGDLLEMYGDAKGRARMNLGENKKLGSSWFNLIRIGDGDYTQQDIEQWAAHLSPRAAFKALAKLVTTHHQETKPNDRVIARVLFALPNMAKKCREKSYPLLVAAMANIQEEYAYSLTNIGCSLSRKGVNSRKLVKSTAQKIINYRYANKDTNKSKYDWLDECEFELLSMKLKKHKLKNGTTNKQPTPI